MKINPISVDYSLSRQKCKNANRKTIQQPSFSGKYTCTKALGGIFGAAGTLGALGGIAIMTGGVSLIPTLAYGALCAGSGATLGYMLDKGSDKKKDK